MNHTMVGDTAIAWEETGSTDAPTVILCHSLGHDHEMWRPQIEPLAERHRVIAVDMRGHGRSDASPPPYDLDLLGTDVLAVADSAGVDRFTVCGLSIGGQIALWLGIEASDRLDAVVACDTAARIGSQQSWAERIAQVEADGLDALAVPTRGRWWSPDFAFRHPDWLAAGLRTLVSTDPAGYIGGCSALATADLRPRITEITAPTLVVVGSLDQSTTVADAEWLHSHIPVSDLLVIEGAAHIANQDRHEAFTEGLVGFLATV